MKAPFLIIAFCIIAILANAQTKTMSNHSLTIHTFGTSYNYEQSLGSKITLTGSLGLMMPYWAWTIQSHGWAYALNPIVGLDPRFYYNLETRNNKGKNIKYNSANYLSVECLYLFRPAVSDNTSLLSGGIISPNWGIRRVYSDRWLLEFSLGVKCFWGSEEHLSGLQKSKFSWGPRINLKFGIVL